MQGVFVGCVGPVGGGEVELVAVGWGCGCAGVGVWGGEVGDGDGVVVA